MTQPVMRGLSTVWVVLGLGVALTVAAVLLWPGHLDAGASHLANSTVHPRNQASADLLENAVQFSLNVLLFVPVGATATLALGRWWGGALAGLLLSAACEACQIWIP